MKKVMFSKCNCHRSSVALLSLTESVNCGDQEHFLKKSSLTVAVNVKIGHLEYSDVIESSFVRASAHCETKTRCR